MDSAFYREEEFQDTQRGKFPKEWKILRFNKLLSLEYGKGLPEQKRMLGMYPVVGSNGVIGYHSRALVRGPGIVIGRKGTIGAVTWIDSDFWPIDTTYYVKVTSSDVDLKWLFYELVHLNLPKLSLADVVPGLKRELANNLVIPHPPLSEQRAIVGVLGVVDLAVAKAGEVIAKTERLKKGLMQELLTKGLGHKEYEYSKELRYQIPKEWQIGNLGDKNVAVLVMGQSPPSSTYNNEKAGLPFLQGKAEFGEVYPSPIVYCSKPIKIAESNDVLLSVRAPVGDVNLAPYKLCIGRGLSAIRAMREKLHYLFLFYYLKFSKRKFESLSMGSTFKAIRTEEIENLKIPLPPSREQQEIVEILSIVDRKLEFERAEKKKLERIKRGLMDLLLTGKVRVKVD